MRPINIYALTRIEGRDRLSKIEKQMSKRNRFLGIKEWEIEGLAGLSKRLCACMPRGEELTFYYSFIMPKLGKEFDLLRIAEDSVVNIELKSGEVPDDTIKKQLLQNRYYLSTLGRNTFFYTYISGPDRLVRLSNSGRLVEATWEELAALLESQTQLYDGAIEDLFKEENYLISPLTDPDKFLRREYFLTSQQREIRKQIIKNIRRWESDKNGILWQGITGLPGTGKTILLYDIAMELSEKEKVCILHYGSYGEKLQKLDQRLRRVDFFEGKIGDALEESGPYVAILVDEAHEITPAEIELIRALGEKWKAPVIFSYDKEDAVSLLERRNQGSELIEREDGFIRFRLTNRIRLNSELSSFIACLMREKRGAQRRSYPSVSLAYANNSEEAAKLLGSFGNNGYVYLWDPSIEQPYDSIEVSGDLDGVSVPVKASACKEYDQLVMLMDKSFYYDEDGFLRSSAGGEGQSASDSRVVDLFHGLSRAKRMIALVILRNQEVFDKILEILQ
ncbi:MAG: ATP-binding protein [Lachnospiraceae bacterium]|nr:ATP-binding protein [Lachnospiraceae bacterium]